jgi:hypothetical protein
MTMEHPEGLTAELKAEGFVPFDGWRREGLAYCPVGTHQRLADGTETTITMHRVAA